MIQSSKEIICFLFIVMAFSVLVQLAEATTMSFTVHAGEKESKRLSLAVEDHVLIKFTVVGQSDNALNFSITYPNGTVKEFGKVITFDYSFVCDAEGEYFLNFSNRESSEDKFVTLDYEVQHYIFGIPQMLFLTIIIVMVCMVAVAAFILMGKPR